MIAEDLGTEVLFSKGHFIEAAQRHLFPLVELSRQPGEPMVSFIKLFAPLLLAALVQLLLRLFWTLGVNHDLPS